MLRVLLADDHHIVRKAIRERITRNAGWDVCGEASDGEEAFALALETRPDLVVADVSMSGMNGVLLARRLHQELPVARVLLFTMRDDDETVSAALAAGVRGYVLKSDAEYHLMQAIAALHANRPYFSPYVSEMLLEAALTGSKGPRLGEFTSRELEVAHLIAEGAGNKQIARQLGIHLKTVESHRAAAMRKAGVHSAGAFVRFAIKNHLIMA